MKGIEPSCQAWEACILPLNYIREQLRINAIFTMFFHILIVTKLVLVVNKAYFLTWLSSIFHVTIHTPAWMTNNKQSKEAAGDGQGWNPDPTNPPFA